MLIIRKYFNRKKYRELMRQEQDESEQKNRPQGGQKTEYRPIPKSITQIVSDTPESLMKTLNSKERRAIKVTWRSLQKRDGLRPVTLVFMKMFENLMKEQPKIRKIFCNPAVLLGGKGATMYSHAHLLAKYIDTIIQYQTYEPSELVSAGTIGQAHQHLAGAGFSSEMWEYFGQTLSATMLAQECVRDCAHAPHAWNMLIAALTDHFRHSFDQKIRRNSSPFNSVTQLNCSKSIPSLNFSSQPNTSSFYPLPERPGTDTLPRKNLKHTETLSSSAQSTPRKRPKRALPATPGVQNSVSCDAMAQSRLAMPGNTFSWNSLQSTSLLCPKCGQENVLFLFCGNKGNL